MEIQVAGPITRHARDLLPVLKVLCNPHKFEQYNMNEKVIEYLIFIKFVIIEIQLFQVNLGRLRYFMMPDDGNRVATSSVIPALREAQQKVIKHILLQYDRDVSRVYLILKICYKYKYPIPFLRFVCLIYQILSSFGKKSLKKISMIRL